MTLPGDNLIFRAVSYRIHMRPPGSPPEPTSARYRYCGIRRSQCSQCLLASHSARRPSGVCLTRVPNCRLSRFNVCCSQSASSSDARIRRKYRIKPGQYREPFVANRRLCPSGRGSRDRRLPTSVVVSVSSMWIGSGSPSRAKPDYWALYIYLAIVTVPAPEGRPASRDR